MYVITGEQDRDAVKLQVLIPAINLGAEKKDLLVSHASSLAKLIFIGCVCHLTNILFYF